MAARSGNIPFQQITAFFRNFADEDGRTLGESPEQRQRTKISPQVTTPPAALQNYTYLNDTRFGLVPRDDLKIIKAGRRGEVLPISVNIAFQQRGSRGQSFVGARTVTGRWENLGQAPADGTGIGFDYWERILLDPNVVDLGNVVSDVEVNVTIRNTFRRDTKDITDIDNNAGAGITVTGSIPPTTIAPLFDKIYVITVATVGPPNIDGTIDWTTTVGILTLTLTGTRIIIFPYPPERGIKEELNWLTDVLKSSDGTEQRHSLRVNPRQVVSYDVFAQNQSDVNNIRNLMIDWTTRVFGVPIWWHELSLTADVAASDLIVNVLPGGLDTADFRIGGLAMIYQENDDGTRTLDTLEIANVIGSVASPESTQNTITFATAIQNDYDGSKATITPVYPGILANGASVNNYKKGDSARYLTKFRILDNIPSIRGLEPGDYPELSDFDGTPRIVIDDKIFIDSNVFQEKFVQKAQLIDFGLGTFTQLTQELKARRITPFGWRIETAEEQRKVRSLLHHLRGKVRTVWVPTWRDDFELISNIGGGASTIDVANEGFSKYVGGSKPWAGLRIEKTDGTVFYHRITIATEIDTTTDRLSIDPVTASALTIAEVERLDLMVLSRLTDDSVEIVHNWKDSESDDEDTTIDVQFSGDLRV
jgi:hypothetical protein